MTVPNDAAVDESPGAPDGRRRLSTTPQRCAVRRDVLGHVGNRWSALVLTLLEEEPRRYSKIRESCGITPRMLTLTLRELERDGLLSQASTAGVRPRTAYALTDEGRSLCAIIRSLISWSDRNHEYILDSRHRFAAADGAMLRPRS